MRSATRGATVTRQLLAVGGQQPIDRIAVDVNATITKLEASLRRVAGPVGDVYVQPRAIAPRR